MSCSTIRVRSFPHCTIRRKNCSIKCICWDTSPSRPARNVNMVNKLFSAIVRDSLNMTGFCPLFELCACGLWELYIGTLSPVSIFKTLLADTPRASNSSVSKSHRTRFLLFPRYGFELLYSRVENMQYTHSFARIDDCGSTSSSLLQQK